MTMPGMTAEELAAVRADFAAQVLPDRGTVRREVHPGTYETVLDDLPCRLSPVTNRQAEEWGELAARFGADALLRAPHDAQLLPGDHVRINGARCVLVWVHPAPRVHQTALARIEQSKTP